MIVKMFGRIIKTFSMWLYTNVFLLNLFCSQLSMNIVSCSVSMRSSRWSEVALCLQVAKALLLRYHPLFTALIDKVTTVAFSPFIFHKLRQTRGLNFLPLCVLEAFLSARWCRPRSDGSRRLLAADERLCRRPEPQLSRRRTHHVPPALLQREFSQVGTGLQRCTTRYLAPLKPVCIENVFYRERQTEIEAAVYYRQPLGFSIYVSIGE